MARTKSIASHFARFWAVALWLFGLALSHCARPGESSATGGGGASDLVQVKETDGEPSLVAAVNIPCDCENLIAEASRGVFSRLVGSSSSQNPRCVYGSEMSSPSVVHSLTVVGFPARSQGDYESAKARAESGLKVVDGQRVERSLSGGGSLFVVVTEKQAGWGRTSVAYFPKEGVIVRGDELIDQSLEKVLTDASPEYIAGLVQNGGKACRPATL